MSFLDYLKRGDNQILRVRPTPALDKELLAELAQNMEEDEWDDPDDAASMGLFEEDLRTQLERHTKKLTNGARTEKGEPIRVDSATAVYLSDDKMRGYLCLLPPLNGGKDAKLEDVLEDVRFEGLAYGIDMDALRKTVEGKRYLHIVLIARGLTPKDGEDAQISDFFTRKDVFELELQEGERIDFDEKNLIQAVHKGEVLCRLTPETLSVDGTDVTGRVLHGRSGRHLSLPRGENTFLSQDRLFLIAEIDGAVCTRDGRFCIERQHVVFSDVNQAIGDLNYPGAVLIKGDVLDGMTVRATGNIIIEGAVRNATIISDGSVRIQRGIQGNRNGGVRAARQVQCKLIADTTVVAGGSVFADTLSDSDVTAGGSVYVTGGRGLVAGGQVKVRNALEARRVGNQSGCLTIIVLNYNPELKSKASWMQDELKKLRSTLVEIQKHIAALRLKTGNLSPDRRELLARLVEQRALYEKQAADMEARVRELSEELRKAPNSRLVCGEILPTTVIRLGEKSVTVRAQESDCRVHMAAGELELR